jgi:FkbM family methyltransferase
MLGYIRPLTQAVVSERVHVLGSRVHVPGSRAIRLSVVAGNIRIHRVIDALVRPGATVVDVGANIGYNTVYAATRVGAAGRVIAIEPAHDNLAVLHENIATGHLQNVIVHSVAAGRVHEHRDLFLRGEVSAVNSFFPDSVYAEVTGVEHVRVAPLDDLVHEDPSLVKIDVEGAELDVLAGMSRLLQTPSVHLVVEWHVLLQEAAGYAPDALPRTLIAQGFTLDAAGHTRVTRVEPRDIPTMVAHLRKTRRPVELVAHRSLEACQLRTPQLPGANPHCLPAVFGSWSNGRHWKLGVDVNVTPIGALNRTLGLLRSLVIYHGIPLRQRRLRRFYRQFVSPDSMVFDVGAHAGNHARALASLGCHVVALEPQPDFVRLLRVVFARSTRVRIIDAAVTDSVGTAALWVSDRTPTVTTLADDWRDSRRRDADFAGVRWNRRIEVPTTTLDALIARFGVPAFIKIDVEGAEPTVLAGLHTPVRVISFECLPQALDHARACVARLDQLGPYRFNWSIGESYRLASDRWIDGGTLLKALEMPDAQRRAGDVYARLSSVS